MRIREQIARAVSALIILAVIVSSSYGENLRFVSYNITAAGGAPRTGLGTILEAIGNEVVSGVFRPIDLISLQEVQAQSTTSQSVVNTLNGIYGAGVYARGNTNGVTTGAGTQGVVYNTQTLQLINETAFGATGTSGAARQPIRYQFRPVGGTAAQDFYVYSMHWKAGDTSTDEARRLVEANLVRANSDLLGDAARIIYTGDFNTYSSGDDGYAAILAAGNGMGADPVNTPGSWHDSNSFKLVHTQSPTTDGSGGLTTGGMDDRFDFQIVSDEMMAVDPTLISYRSGSYHTFGNNGTHPLNGDIDNPSNTALPGLSNRLTVLDLLSTVSDHLPVVADYTYSVPEPLGVAPIMAFTLILIRRRAIG